jgi:hypothetical protein
MASSEDRPGYYAVSSLSSCLIYQVGSFEGEEIPRGLNFESLRFAQEEGRDSFVPRIICRFPPLKIRGARGVMKETPMESGNYRIYKGRGFYTKLCGRQ